MSLAQLGVCRLMSEEPPHSGQGIVPARMGEGYGLRLEPGRMPSLPCVNSHCPFLSLDSIMQADYTQQGAHEPLLLPDMSLASSCGKEGRQSFTCLPFTASCRTSGPATTSIVAT